MRVWMVIYPLAYIVFEWKASYYRAEYRQLTSVESCALDYQTHVAFSGTFFALNCVMLNVGRRQSIQMTEVLFLISYAVALAIANVQLIIASSRLEQLCLE
jgi:hypothetical protein